MTQTERGRVVFRPVSPVQDDQPNTTRNGVELFLLNLLIPGNQPVMPLQLPAQQRPLTIAYGVHHDAIVWTNQGQHFIGYTARPQSLFVAVGMSHIHEEL